MKWIALALVLLNFGYWIWSGTSVGESVEAPEKNLGRGGVLESTLGTEGVNPSRERVCYGVEYFRDKETAGAYLGRLLNIDKGVSGVVKGVEVLVRRYTVRTTYMSSKSSLDLYVALFKKSGFNGSIVRGEQERYAFSFGDFSSEADAVSLFGRLRNQGFVNVEIDSRPTKRGLYAVDVVVDSDHRHTKLIEKSMVLALNPPTDARVKKKSCK